MIGVKWPSGLCVKDFVMKLTVRRVRQGKYSTLSDLYIDDVFFCYALEDKIRLEKIWGGTAIPEGTYKLDLRRFGGMHSRYTKRYPKMHQGMLELLNVPDYKYVYMHIGNNIGDTAGCLLVGDSYEYIDEDYELRKSASAYKRLYKRVVAAVKSGQAEVHIVNAIEKEKKK